MIDQLDDSLSQSTVSKFTEGATILAVLLYEKDGHMHLLLDNGAILTIHAINAEDGMPEKLKIGILGPAVPESPLASPGRS